MNFSNNTPPLMMIAKNSVRLLAISLLFSCMGNAQKKGDDFFNSTKSNEALKTDFINHKSRNVMPAADDVSSYVDMLKGKRVAIVANHTSMVSGTHLVDTLIGSGIDVAHVFAPEHGFRGDQGAGAHIKDDVDAMTGLSIYSLHGKTKKPSSASLQNVDVVLFDIQDVGVRFYTYISTLHYVMEACAQNDVPIIILDRPNPNLVLEPDGPVLEEAYSSFIGMHPVPVLYGLTIGEYGKMINGEGWLDGSLKADLTVMPCENYTRASRYTLPKAPSPNLPNQKSIYLYPSLCFFEGTVVSIGRGTDVPFQIVGHPKSKMGSYTFTPESNAGAKYPKLEGETCNGLALTSERAEAIHETGKLDLTLLLNFYKDLDMGEDFFRSDGFFNLLAGNDKLRSQIQNGVTEAEIRNSWREGLASYEKFYTKYWIYER